MSYICPVCGEKHTAEFLEFQYDYLRLIIGGLHCGRCFIRFLASHSEELKLLRLKTEEEMKDETE